MAYSEKYPADHLTPISAYAILRGEGRCLLESVSAETGKKVAFLGLASEIGFTYFCDHGSQDPFEMLHQIGQQCALPAVGFVAYDAVRSFEKIPDRHPNPLDLPDFLFSFYHTYLVFDEATGIVSITAPSQKEVQEIFKRLEQASTLPLLQFPEKSLPIEYDVDLDDACFQEKVRQAKEHIIAGDVFQVVISRTFTLDGISSAFDLYRSLRAKSPAPYHFLMEYEGFSVVGASPEKLVSVRENVVESVPIAGTICSGENIEDLLNDPKENAEHMMLVDLARNDLGRVCQPGSVQVMEKRQARRFSHTTHLVSRVIGKLNPKMHPLHALKACFPAGTLSGAPKVRAMELIDKLENSRRGIYGGAIVFLDGQGNLDSSIAIRSALVREGKAYVRAGSGIVLDSDPEKETRETCLKANSVLEAAALVREAVLCS